MEPMKWYIFHGNDLKPFDWEDISPKPYSKESVDINVWDHIDHEIEYSKKDIDFTKNIWIATNSMQSLSISAEKAAEAFEVITETEISGNKAPCAEESQAKAIRTFDF